VFNEVARAITMRGSFPHRRGSRSTPAGEHRPVMLDAVLRVLAPRPGECAVDCTLGLGGHAVAILRAVGPTGRLLGVDWDGEHLEEARDRLAAVGYPFEVRQANFAALPRLLADAGVAGVDMLVADLGMSSMQLDDAARGFSYVRDGPLDMRMDRSRGRSAAEWLATISQPDLSRALAELGGEPHASAIARALVAARAESPLQRCADVAQVVARAVGLPVERGRGGWRLHPRAGRWNLHPAARTFQALRMLVNRELGNLQELLRVLGPVLRPQLPQW
jgi:16S rRNA (cytosine1402-N4)-methyltransferase